MSRRERNKFLSEADTLKNNKLVMKNNQIFKSKSTNKLSFSFNSTDKGKSLFSS